MALRDRGRRRNRSPGAQRVRVGVPRAHANASARHQALHHFVATAEWSDDEMLRRVCQWVVPKMDFAGGCS
jgi:SRSO17 transposase